MRFAVLHYFAACYSPNPTVMPVAIEALERFGRAETFQFTHPIAELAQTVATLRWAVRELHTQPGRTQAERNHLDSICRLLYHADPRLVQPLEQDILAAPAFDPEYRERLSRRLKLLAWDGQALWRELEVICVEGKDKASAGELRWQEAEDIVEQLARQGSQHAERMMELLRQKVEYYEDHPLNWMEPLMVMLAGELRYEPAIPLLVSKLHQDAEVLSEECQTALIKIGGDDVVRAVRQDYPTAEWHFRLYASDVLGRVHTDLAVQVLIELLPQEQDLDLQNFLAQALVEHFSSEGNEAARSVLLDDPDLDTLRNKLVAACGLMGQDFTELERWRKEAEEEKRRKLLLYGRAASSPPPERLPSAPPKPLIPIQKAEKKVVGRNDPCPCASGKKFKKCCMNQRPTI